MNTLTLHIVTDFINALPGNSSVNTIQHATIDEVGTTRLCNPILSNGSVNTLRVNSDASKKRNGVFRGVCAECLEEK
jgi:hypothetical protein